MITINIEHISPEKAREILNHFADKNYINNMNCNYDFNYNSSINLQSNNTDIFIDLAEYFV